MALLTTVSLSEGEGTSITTASASASGDTFTYNNNTMLYVTNGSGSSVTVTITAVGTSSFVGGVGNLTKSDIVKAVADGAVAILDSRSIAYRGATGLVSVSYSDETSVTVAPIEIDRV